ncbi:MAG: hypothetical protein O9972_32995 [Burkholderiales bacterium]|nr:hypothetical protein [Burkholderiales bacterium]
MTGIFGHWDRPRGARRAAAAVVAGLALAGFAAPASAQRTAPPPPAPRAPGQVVACDFSGWSVDRDAFGLQVRYEPKASSAVLARLPGPRVIGVDEVAVLVRVTGYSDGWFRIGSAFFPAEADEAFSRQSATWFRGEGWVPADRIKATLAADTLRAGPRANARVVASLRGTRGGFPLTPDSVAVKRLVSCQGQWVQAETEFGTGWVSRVCGRQLEQC